MTTTTKTEAETRKTLSKEELVELVLAQMAWNGHPVLKHQAEAAVNAVLDTICDALAERREVQFMHRFRLTPVARKARTTHVPIPGKPGETRQIDLPEIWGIRVRVGGWLKKRMALGKKPRHWARWSV